MVFSHPNHELAVFGFMQRVRPWILYLTDGGGSTRVEQTQRGLSEIGLLDKATFLNHPEASFYQALVNRDVNFFRRVSMQIRKIAARLHPAYVLCDAIEFYNPVHDLSLPLVKTALGAAAKIFEIPLIYQIPAATERYAIQRMPSSRQKDCLTLQLTEEELRRKRQGRDTIYTVLLRDMGQLLRADFSRYARSECFVPAERDVGLPTISAERVLRYEWRAELLKAQKAIRTAITYRKNYLPVVERL